MQYTDLLTDAEFWTNQSSGSITGVSATKSLFTALINRRLERAMGMLGASSRTAQADDTNYTDQPFSLFDIVSGQNDYQFLVDEDGNAITDITSVLIKPNGATDFIVLERLTLNDTDAELIMSPNASNTGTPTGYIERNNTIFLNKIPNWNSTQGAKLFYKRVPSYFTTSDTTKAPGFNADHHRILSLGASYDWILVNKPENQMLLSRIEGELNRSEKEFKTYAQMRNPNRNRMTVSQESNR